MRRRQTSPLAGVSLLPLALLLLLSLAAAQPNANPVRKPVRPGPIAVHMRVHAKIPDWKGKPSKIVAIVPLGKNLFVTTSTSGGLIYRISNSRRVSRWMDVNAAFRKRSGRSISFDNPVHGGLRGLAFHPRFFQNGRFYVSAMERRPANPRKFRYFSRTPRTINADSVVVEFRADVRKLTPIMNSYREVLRIGMPVYDHPIKQITFMWNNLLVAHGDGSVQSATAGGGQGNDGLGKILRINPLKSQNGPYSIPPKNPFVKNRRYKPEIYALGFRNPHNLCYSRKRRALYVTDAGRDNVEEINIVKSGHNYGWSEREGTFVHRERGGIGIGAGVAKLPNNDAKFGFEYPAVQVGHNGPRNAKFNGQALAGSCPIENGSLLNGLILYANFPGRGELYYSKLNDMHKARTRGKPGQLTQATTYRARILFDHDNNPRTPPLRFDLLRDVVRRDPRSRGTFRTDMRFGVGSDGTIYWSSKTNGRVYIITSSKPGWKP